MAFVQMSLVALAFDGLDHVTVEVLAPVRVTLALVGGSGICGGRLGMTMLREWLGVPPLKSPLAAATRVRVTVPEYEVLMV
jgi:hypothetical protein